MTDQSSLAEKPAKSLFSMSDRNRDKIALSDWKFPNALPSMTSSSESLDLLSALEVFSATKISALLMPLAMTWSATCSQPLMIHVQTSWRVFPRAHLHTVGMLQFMSLTHTNQACPLLFILFLCLLPSLWPFQLYFLPTTLCFLTLFFRSYFCLIGPFNYISLYESLPQP